MKRLNVLVFSLVFCFACCLGVEPSWALSDADYKKFIKDSPEFAAADKRLNAAWKALGAAAPKDRMAEYREAQRAWSKTERDEYVERMFTIAKAQENFTEILPKAVLKKGKVDRALAYAKITDERAIWLEELTHQERDAGYIPSFKGLLEFSHNPAGGYWAFTPDGWFTSFMFCYVWNDEIPACADAKEILDEEDPARVMASGRLNGKPVGGWGFDWDGRPETLSVKKLK